MTIASIDCYCGGKSYATNGFGERAASVICMRPDCGLQVHAAPDDTAVHIAIFRWNALQNKLKATNEK